MYFHFLFKLQGIKQKEKELSSISNKNHLLVTAPFSFLEKGWLEWSQREWVYNPG